MNILNKILSLFIAVIFLISSAGLFLILHECSTCKISEIYFNTDKHDHFKIKADKHDSLKSCCSESDCESSLEPETKEMNCCEEEALYLKLSESYTYSINTIKFTEISFSLIDFVNIKIHKELISKDLYSEQIKPPNLLGRQILLKNSVLIL